MSILGKRIVTIGGGTGGFTVNRGLHKYPVYPTAICTVFDSGGSSGILRDEFGSLPQGDIRRCLIALADDKDDTLRQLFTYRFNNDADSSSLKDHSLGNLLLLAADKTWGTIEGIRRVSSLLHIQGEVLPVSVDNAHLVAELSDGSVVRGETNIDLRSRDDDRIITKIWLEPKAMISREAADAIMQADTIVLGPGDLYTSIIPNLLVDGVADAIARSNAKLVYVANLMTKWSETRGFTLTDFLKTLVQYGVGRDKFDAVFVNDAPIPPELLTLYAEKEKVSPVLYNGEEIERFAKHVWAGNLLSMKGVRQNLIRHSSSRLAKAIVEF